MHMMVTLVLVIMLIASLIGLSLYVKERPLPLGLWLFIITLSGSILLLFNVFRPFLK